MADFKDVPPKPRGEQQAVSLSFTCPHCNTAIVVKYLRVGEPFRCQSCRYHGTVPTDAIQTGEESTALKEALQRIPKPPPPVTGPFFHGYLLADRGERFLARFAENALFSVAYFIILIPAIAIFDLDDPRLFFFYFFIMMGIFILSAVGIQAYLLATRSQSLGKLMFGIKIIRHDSGEDAGLVWGWLVREFANDFIGIIPFYALVDVLFIFSEEKRCVHDHLAGTLVVKLPPEPATAPATPIPQSNPPLQ